MCIYIYIYSKWDVSRNGGNGGITSKIWQFDQHYNIFVGQLHLIGYIQHVLVQNELLAAELENSFRMLMGKIMTGHGINNVFLFFRCAGLINQILWDGCFTSNNVGEIEDKNWGFSRQTAGNTVHNTHTCIYIYIYIHTYTVYIYTYTYTHTVTNK